MKMTSRRNRKVMFFAIVASQITAILIIHQTTTERRSIETSYAPTNSAQGNVGGFLRHLPLENVYQSWRNLTGFKKEVTSFMFERNPNMFDVDCDAIMEGNESAIMYTKTKIFEGRKKRMVLPDEEVATWSRNCTAFKIRRKYITIPLSSEETEYPIAYIINLYTSIQSFEHLLRSVYNPQNIYCIHVDQNSGPEFTQRVADIVKCFNNVFLASKMVKVYWAHWSLVQSNLNCMEDLMKTDISWKYVINLCAFDFPTKTNLEIVRALKKLDGKNSVVSWNFIKTPNKISRITRHHISFPIQFSRHVGMIPTLFRKVPAPHNITAFSGSFFYAFRKEAVDYLLHDPKIQDLFKWAEDTFIPDEMVFSTIQRMHPQLPGSVPPDLEHDTDETIVRYQQWGGTCYGKLIRGVCVFAAGDLNRIVDDFHLFLNKIGFKVDPVAAECLSEHIRKRAIQKAIMLY